MHTMNRNDASNQLFICLPSQLHQINLMFAPQQLSSKPDGCSRRQYARSGNVGVIHHRAGRPIHEQQVYCVASYQLIRIKRQVDIKRLG